METPRRLRPEAEEHGLVERMRAGDERAFDEFAERYLPGLYRFALRRLDGDRELTRDLVQSTVCHVIQKLDGYRGEAPLFTWLCACCRNEIGMHFRRRGRRPHEVELDEVELRGGLPASAAAGPQERLLRFEESELVHVALDRLPPSYARAVEWRYLEGAAVDEIARRLDSTYKAAESLLSRARTAFREVYEQLAASPALGAEP
jgi:RNA polymerase sigma-70 factor (ECF subfamily)